MKRANRGSGLGLKSDLAFAAVLGALQSLAFVWLWLWPAQVVIVALFAWRAALAGPGRAMGLGMAFGTAWVAAGTWWLYISMHRYGGLPAVLAVLAIGGLAAFLSLYLGLATSTFARWRTGSPFRQALLFGALWLLAELARGVIFTGFPWVASGYAHVDSPLGGFAPWLGVYGIGFVVATWAAWLALGLMSLRRIVVPMRSVDVSTGGLLESSHHAEPDDATERRRAQRLRHRRTIVRLVAGSAALLLVAWSARHIDFTERTQTLGVSLLQGNVPQDEKFEPDSVPAALAWTDAALRRTRGDLVVGPETVIPVLLSQLDPVFWHDLTTIFTASPDRAAIIGAPLGDDRTGYTNSALGLSAASAQLPAGYYRYDKHHLVPFGEFIPNGFHWFTQMMNIPLGDFDRGATVQPSFTVKGERVAPNICYEDLFGEELAGRFTNPATAPTILANISNIGWFGDTIAVGQHLQISRMRTLELQRPMLRATNTGATAVIDHRAVVTAALEPFTQGVLESSVEGRRGTTPFAWWAGRFDLWPLWLAALLMVALLRVRRQR